jgi:ATP adenylyltransferase
VFVILNKYPYNNGHLMVVPFRHIGRMADANSEELGELIRLVRISEMVLTEAYQAHGINVGMNLGRSAGAGVPGHMHVHLVPRWQGDTNFMSVVGNTRVVPEEPADSVNRLKPIFQKLVTAG